MEENIEICFRNIKCEHCWLYEKCFKEELELERQMKEKEEGGASEVL